MKILQINTTVNTGSHGRIAEDIGKVLLAQEHESMIAAAYTTRGSASGVITIGAAWDRKLHGLITRLLDRHGLGSVNSSHLFIDRIKDIKPDIIHLHNIHGYYLNIRILFDYLKAVQLPVVWTFHDCWPFTGHCSFFDAFNCSKWQTECNHCPNIKGYPASWGVDQSRRNFGDKKQIFNGLNSIQIVTPSQWLANHVSKSFLSSYPAKVIHNGIDLNAFQPNQLDEGILAKYKLSENRILLGVASIWDKRKGLDDFIKLSQIINKDIQIVLVGLNKNQLSNLPGNITGVERTENIEELAALYSDADVFLNPTYVDNFPTTNIEALACGTPVITYNTGGSPEAVDNDTGLVVEKGNIEALHAAVIAVLSNGKTAYTDKCRARAVAMFNKDDRYRDYLELYKRMI